MSRRKQARPRHVDDPDLESPAITAISVVPVFTDEDSISTTEVEGCEKIDTPPDINSDEKADKLPAHIPGYLTDQQALDSETKTCKNCQTEFLSVGEWFLHKNECLKPPIMLMFEDIQEQAEIKSDVSNGTVFDSETSVHVERETVEHYPSINDPGQTDKENNNIDSDNAETDEEEDQNNFDDHSNIDDLDDYNSSLEDDDAEFDDLKQNDMNKKRKQGPTAAELAAYMQQLSSLIPTMTAAANSSSNVMLEPLEATKAAVAQFAENNPDQEREVSKLHAALFNLQQQQIMQLQLIQQLQQQLIANGTHVGQLHSGLINNSMSLGGFANIGLPGFNMPRLSGSLNKPDVVKTSPRHESPLPKSECPSPTENGRKTSCSSSPEHSDQPSTPPSSGKACTSELTSAPALNKNGGVAVASSSPSTLLLDFTQSSSKGSSKSQAYHGTEGQSFHGTEGPSFHSTEGHLYHGTDDPFFKHKCRLCGKVFGSDSALQIHVRSHTDFPPLHDAFLVDGVPFGLGAALSTDYWTWEKPFQCNICGGRFSTRGNLKVHFQRHKSEFPNVEMNPNPVPEHLDKTPMPMLGSPFPSSTLTPFANPAFMAMPGFMNGFLFPPPHLAPRQPMAAHAMLPQQNLNRENREKRASSPKQDSRPSSQSRKDQSLLKSETPNTLSDAKDSAKILNLASTASFSISRPSHMIPVSSIPLVSTYPVMSSLSTQSHFQPHHSSSMPQSSLPSGDPFRNTILPSNILDNDDNLEQFMEIDKSETSKLQQLVDNIEHKLTDPNQCVICQRVLSCKSALQMHYRIHTGERPFKCKICGRSFTTKGNLKTHMGVHRAKPPLRMMHQCPVCHKQFTNLLVLQQHIRSHTGMSALPGLPGMSHMGLFAPHPNMQEHYRHSPLNMKHHYPESYEKELDLSKKPRLDGPNLDNCSSNSNHINGEREDMEGNDIDSDNEDHNEMDDEANKLAADDAKKEGLGRENNHFKSTPENVNDATKTRADLDRQLSNRSDDIGSMSSLARAPSPKYLQEDSNHGQENSYNAYSTSLAALEERVRQIDTTMACNPLSQFHAAPFLLAPSYLNGDRSVSPKSESGSDEGRKPSTPGSSNGSINGNYMLGALDGRPLDGNSKATTCNVCYKTFACKSALDIHYRSHTHERPYKCDLCDKTFTTRGNMKQHLLTHKLNGEMSDNDDCENNNNSCTPNQNENDSDNDNDTRQSTQLESQHTSIHNESQDSASKKKDIVSPPEKSSSTIHSPAASLDRHNTSYTSPESHQSPFISKTPTVKHQCLVCQKGFSSASALQIHIRTHTGDKPFKCTVCGKAFTTKGNLKVHMGTHMWNNSPSRRGRRMSIEPPFMLAHKENPYLPHGFPPRPDFYPFQFPPFMNGLPSLKSLSEVSMMVGNNCRMGIKQELSSPPSVDRRKSETSPVLEEKPKYAESGELDLSMKSTGSSGSRSSEKTSPSSIDSNSSGMVSPPHMSLGWGWKASCHLCSRSFPTPVALEHHIRSMHMMNESLSKGGAS